MAAQFPAQARSGRTSAKHESTCIEHGGAVAASAMERGAKKKVAESQTDSLRYHAARACENGHVTKTGTLLANASSSIIYGLRGGLLKLTNEHIDELLSFDLYVVRLPALNHFPCDIYICIYIYITIY
jgi:hypothetical protein